ncbi:HlyD family type I secretion periplasmic adaptor subunit [Methylomonas albis]|uniref:Membrane fusion protein (MFP) family protein n=1 Tax=Methylomonas albis TaxID=1854563 RepID=A0ABR9D594_9GAMM|nr:HlyD family type I secretion periplasmic adaptor subunit [Methylomonas albis]MBD9357384.1 HlyD family type I secretion periplasmic adaptor subunit [Methylomonas albis]
MNSPLKTDALPILLLTDDRPIRMIGLIVLISTLGVFGLWAYLAPIDGAALASGFVVVKSHKKTVQHLDGGIVSQLLVKDGDIVKEGDLLLTLDGTENKAQLEIARGQFITLAAQVARLEAERDGKTTVVYPETLNDSADPRILEAKKTENQIFSARKNAHEGEMAVLKQRIGQLNSKIDGLHGQRTSKQELMASYSEEVRDLKELLAEGFADKQRLRDVERNHTLNSGEVSALSSDIAAAQIQIGETKLEILQLEKKFQEEVAGKLSEAQTELYDVNQRMLATRDKVVRIDIKAPVAGRIMGLAVHTLGGVILPGHPILDIVPQQEELIVDAQVSPLDIDRVSVGLVAEVRFTAFKQALTPIIEGKVINLSADRLVEEKSGTPYYQAQIELTQESYQKMKNLELVPGMPVEVLIKTGERTVFEYLTKPISNAFARAFIED